MVMMLTEGGWFPDDQPIVHMLIGGKQSLQLYRTINAKQKLLKPIWWRNVGYLY